jgi:hypothetical protein
MNLTTIHTHNNKVTSRSCANNVDADGRTYLRFKCPSLRLSGTAFFLAIHGVTLNEMWESGVANEG